MRDIVMFLVVFGAIPFILRNPYVGVLVWSWLSYMNPHRLAWGPAYNFPFAQVVAIVLLVSLLFDKEPKRLPFGFLLFVWITFLIWTVITTIFAFYPELAMIGLVRLVKIQLIIFLTMMIMCNAERIKMMIWVIYFSLGFYGIKGGIYAIRTGGSGRVWGPGGFVEDNNTLAVALLMILPLGYYLIRHEIQNKWFKFAMWCGMLSISLSIVASQSRGAFLSIICVAFFLWLKTDKKIITGVFVLSLLPMMFAFMPDSWHERMATIETYEQDSSAMGRIYAWTYSVNAANDRITGAGINSWSEATYARYSPEAKRVLVAHSIYFGILADQGWFGLLLFVTVFLGAFLLARRVAKIAGALEEFRWASDLAKMIQVSLIAYGTGGAFLSLSYFDLPWHLVAIILMLQQLLKREGVWEQKQQPFAQRLMQSRGISA